MRLHAFNTVKYSEKEMLMFIYQFFYSFICSIHIVKRNFLILVICTYD